MQEFEIIPGALPEGFCPKTTQELVNAIFRGAKIKVLTSLDNIIPSQVQPAAELRGKLWAQMDALFNLIRVYSFSLQHGKWVSPHEIPPGSQVRMLWVGVESDLWSYQGGDGHNPETNPPTAITGAMWEVDKGVSGKFLAAAGTIGGQLIDVNKTGGSHEITIKKENLPAEGITLPDKVVGQPGSGGAFSLNGDTNPADDFKYVNQTDKMGEGKAINVLNPYYTVHVIKRTARQFYTVNAA